MENNTNTAGVEPANKGVDTPQSSELDIDYKVMFEKFKADNEKLSMYNKDLKQKYQSKLTEEEQSKAQLEEREAYYKNVDKELSIFKTKSKLASQVNDEKVLNEIATKFADNDTFGALETLIKYNSVKEQNLRKEIEQELLAKNPVTPPQNSNDSVVTKEQFKNMSYEERNDIYKNNIELYKNLTN